MLRPDAPQRRDDPREVSTARRGIVLTGAQWRDLPTNSPPWEIVSQQAHRWIHAGCFAAMTHDLRVLLSWTARRPADRPTSAILDSRTLPSTPERGARGSWGGAKRRTGSKTHIAVDTLRHLLELAVTPAKTNDRAVVGQLTAAGPADRGGSVQVACVDDGDTGSNAAAAAQTNGIALVAVAVAKRSFVLLRRRWVGERDLAWLSRFRQLARDQERLPRS